jgi:pilus assembly protein Flp/PilA
MVDALARRNSAVARNPKFPIHTTLDVREQVPPAELAQVPWAELLEPRITRAFQTGWRLKLKQKVLKFLADESGATAIEYGLIAAGIALAIIAVVNGLGTNLNDKFTSINNSLK